MLSPLTKFIFETGREQIQQWTKESLQEKPFCTIKGKMWTDIPDNIPLEKIYTELQLMEKNEQPSGVKKTELSNVAELLGKENLIQSGPVRIGITGLHSHINLP